MWDRHLFALDGQRFSLTDSFAADEHAREWKRVEPADAAFVVRTYLRRHPESEPLVATIVEHAQAGAMATVPVEAADLASLVQLELSAEGGRLLLLRRDAPSLRVPPPRDLTPLVLEEVVAEPASFITFELFDQHGTRLAGLPYELAIDGEVVDAASMELGHVHRGDLEPGSQGTLRLPEPSPSHDQTLTIELRDANGAAIGGARFTVLLADGSTRSGALDDGGRAELVGLPRGKALVSFDDALRTTGAGEAGGARRPRDQPRDQALAEGDDAALDDEARPGTAGSRARSATQGRATGGKPAAAAVAASPAAAPEAELLDVVDAAGNSYAGGSRELDFKQCGGEVKIKLRIAGGEPRVKLWIDHAPSGAHADFYARYEQLRHPCVVDLHDDRLKEGAHEHTFDGRDATLDARLLLAGEYCLRMEADFGGRGKKTAETRLVVAKPLSWNFGMDYTSTHVSHGSSYEVHELTKDISDQATSALATLSDGTGFTAATETNKSAAEAIELWQQSAVAFYCGHANPFTVTFAKNDVVTRMTLLDLPDPQNVLVEEMLPDALSDVLLLVLAGCMAGNDYAAVQKKLHQELAEELDPKRSDGQYDERTSAAVMAYQRIRGHEAQTGRLDEPTCRALSIAPETMDAPDRFSVTQLQRKLTQIAASFRLRTRIDGIYGPDTERVVENFQRAAGLPVDGIPEGETLVRLGLGPDGNKQRNIAEALRHRGADITVGWPTKLYIDSLKQWAPAFWGALKDGKTLDEAIGAGAEKVTRKMRRGQMSRPNVYSYLGDPGAERLTPARHGRGS